MTRSELLQIAKPILFNTEMVRAILYERKTVTRRCVKNKYSNTEMKMRTDKYGTRLIEIQKDIEGVTFGKNEDGTTWRKLLGYIEPKPPYKKGDILYVRETWQAVGNIYKFPTNYIYKASPELCPADCPYAHDGKWEEGVCRPTWRPSIHMPKEVARIFLRVTDVRAERLQDITIHGILDEGETPYTHADGTLDEAATRTSFIGTWNSTIKKSDLDRYGWDANPWVWVIEFEREEVERCQS